jgi:hypothetical protein
VARVHAHAGTKSDRGGLLHRPHGMASAVIRARTPIRYLRRIGPRNRAFGQSGPSVWTGCRSCTHGFRSLQKPMPRPYSSAT